MKIKRNLRKMAELGVGLTAIATLILAGCGGSGGGASATGTTPLVVTPALGQVYQGLVTVTGQNGTSRSYSIQSGVPTITADISGMTAPLLIALTGDPANGNKLVFFDEGSGAIASSVVNSTNQASAVRAVVPAITGLSASGVGVTALTEIAAANLADPVTGKIDFSQVSAASAVASAVAANVAGLQTAQKLSGSTTIDDVLAPPTPVNSRATTLLDTVADLHAKILHALATLPAAKYGGAGATAFEKARALGDSIKAGGKLPAGFDADVVVAAASAVTAMQNAGAAPTAFVPQAVEKVDLKGMMAFAARAMSGVPADVNAQKAIMNAIRNDAFNAASGVGATLTGVQLQAAITAAANKGSTAAQAVQQAVAGLGANPTPAAIQAAIQNAWQAAASGLTPASAVAQAQAGAGAIQSSVAAISDFIADVTGTGTYNYYLAMSSSGVPASYLASSGVIAGSSAVPGSAAAAFYNAAMGTSMGASAVGIAPIYAVAGSGVLVSPTMVISHTATLTGGIYNVVRAAKELLANFTWGAPTTNPPANGAYVLTANGWTHATAVTGLSSVDNKDGTITHTDPGKGGTLILSVAETKLDGLPIVLHTNTSVPTSGVSPVPTVIASGVYPTGSRYYEGFVVKAGANGAYEVSQKLGSGPQDPNTRAVFTSEAAVVAAPVWCNSNGTLLFTKQAGATATVANYVVTPAASCVAIAGAPTGTMTGTLVTMGSGSALVASNVVNPAAALLVKNGQLLAYLNGAWWKGSGASAQDLVNVKARTMMNLNKTAANAELQALGAPALP